MSKVETYREDRRIGNSAFAAVIIYETMEADAEAERNALWYSTPSGYSGRSAPACISVVSPHDYKCKGRSRLIATYRTLTEQEYAERHVTYGWLMTKASIAGRKAVLDLAGNVINGIDHTDISGKSTWKIIRGGTIVYDQPHIIFRIRGCVAPFSTFVSHIAADLGRYNLTEMHSFSDGFKEVGKALLVSVTSQPTRFDRSHHWVDYDFLCRTDGWINPTTSRLFEKRVVKYPIYNTAGDALTGTRTVLALVPTSTIRQGVLHTGADFSILETFVV